MTVLTASPFLTPSLSRQGAGLRAAIERATAELASGRVQDQGAAVKGDFSALSALDRSLSRLDGYAAATSALSFTAGAMQTALKTMSDTVDDLASRLTSTAALSGEAQLSTLAASGAQGFATALAAVNTSAGGQSLFAGIETGTAPLPRPDAFLAALETAVAGATTAEMAKTAIAGWFADPGGYAALYQGGDPRAALPVAPGEAAQLSVTALDPALRDTLAGLATLALLDRGLLSGDPAARTALAATAGEDLMSAVAGRVQLQARLGVVEEQVTAAKTRNEAERTTLDIARLSLIEADPYETSARLKDLETRLDAFYTLLSRLSGLSLTGYLR